MLKRKKTLTYFVVNDDINSTDDWKPRIHSQSNLVY